jgi:hypothetical protein
MHTDSNLINAIPFTLPLKMGFISYKDMVSSHEKKKPITRNQFVAYTKKRRRRS